MLVIRHIALAALILRAMLPSGWMPDARATLTICSLEAGITTPYLGKVHHDGPAGQSDHIPGKTNHQECPFAQAGHVVTPPLAVALALPAIHAFAAATDTAQAAVMAARFSPNVPRAPPASA